MQHHHVIEKPKPFDAALIAKYACNGPRYTSYPTALQFDSAFTAEHYAEKLMQAKQLAAPLSLYVHIPFCRHLCYYCACNKVVTKDRKAGRNYLDHLAIEAELVGDLLGRHRKVAQLHFGGGTPTYLDDAELTELIHLLATHFHLGDEKEREYSIEIDPRTVSTDTLALLRGLGFNRLSFGVQDTDTDVQQAINRIQPYEKLKQLVDAARDYQFKSVSLDLIYGLPKQTVTSLSKTLDQVIELSPDRIAFYHYAHLPQLFKPQRAIERHELPSSEAKLSMLSLAAERFIDAGYYYVGMDHFVKANDTLAIRQQEGRLQRNFQGYSSNLSPDVVGIGVSAISSLTDSYTQNHKNLDDYYAALQHRQLPVARGLQTSNEDLLRRHVIMELACNLKLDFKDFKQRFAIDFMSKFADVLPALRAMEADGIVELRHNKLLVTEQGRMLMRNICMLFDAYSNPGKQGFSKTL